MLGIFLSAICALNINASAVTASVDTLDRYIINNQAVGRFDGSQLVGKTISYYKIFLTKGKSESGILRLHVILTDGRKAKEIEEKSSTDGEGGSAGNVETVVTIDGKTYTNANSTIISSKAAIYIINGKKCDKEALTKIKPESIASMTVYKPGCKEAVELSGRKDIAVIKVVTK